MPGLLWLLMVVLRKIGALMAQCATVLFLAGCSGKGHPTTGILITNLPAYGSSDDLGGMVLGADPTACRVAVFINVPPYGWFSKPTCALALTAIHPDGSWSADITTGGADTNATRIAALLVSTNYDHPCVLGEPFLPTNIFSGAMASAVVTREYPGVRWIGFSGYDWWVKASSGTNQLGPGPNYFSDSTNNVWTDAQGWLHLRITHRSNQWQCAEIVSARTFGYGSYRFELGSRVDDLDTNVVLGMFTWSDDPAYADREMDVECSRGFAADTNNTQFTVQPYSLSGHDSRYRVPAGLADSTHLFIWQSNSVSFQCQSGSYSPNPNPTNVLGAWTFANAAAVPQTGDENARINLWLLFGRPPSDGREVELVIKNFQFVPLGSPPPASLAGLSAPSNGPVQFAIGAEPDWRYLVQASANLLDWQNLTTVLATNTLVPFRDNRLMGAGQRFYRTVTLP
ncbi:MAG TPA: glycoside hydrolase family 16 protein [Verrucomicrobiae bacterium]|nr:glycoside hydrolase family 16 protein [Verrucomicrobiae bacterium]